MLKNIKSLYFIQMIFSYTEEGQKLKLIRYNKSFQKNLDISLINYKFFAGKYAIYEPNGILKEYDGNDDKLLFEGECLNGKKNGKGKEYYFAFLAFEGEYLNGKRNGKGKEYSLDKLQYEGEYLNGKRNGKGKEYYDNGNLKFEGEYLNGRKLTGTLYDIEGDICHIYNNVNGQGKEYDDFMLGKLEYEGEYLNGKRNGKGKEYFNPIDGTVHFEGEFKNDKRNGRGKEYYLMNDNLKFDGEYLYNIKWEGKGYDKMNNIIYELKDGKGLMKEYDELGIIIFEGRYEYGIRYGKVFEYNMETELKFEGKYLNKKKFEGHGIEYFINNRHLIFEGEYLYNSKLRGKSYVNGKLEYEGEYLFDKKWNGKGYDENGNVIYELKNGNGKVREYWKNALIFEGEYLNGKRNGKGKDYHCVTGEIIFEGEYLNGRIID